jgi:hypothetical protein
MLARGDLCIFKRLLTPRYMPLLRLPPVIQTFHFKAINLNCDVTHNVGASFKHQSTCVSLFMPCESTLFFIAP